MNQDTQERAVSGSSSVTDGRCDGCGTPKWLNAHSPGCKRMPHEAQIAIMLQPEPNGYGFTRAQAEAYIAGEYDPSDPTHAEYMKDPKPGWAAFLRARRQKALEIEATP